MRHDPPPLFNPKHSGGPTIPLTIAHKSIIGTREEQQDRYFSHSEASRAFVAVCDGMGGLGYGSLASAVAIAKLKEHYFAKEENEPYPVFFLRMVDILDECIANLRGKKGEKLNAGTTIVATALEGDNLYWLSVGDSRLYLIRGAEIVCATRDHNYFLSLKKMKQDAEINTLQYNQEAERGEARISFIGMGGVQIMDINQTPFQPLSGDIILLTTDGLTKALKDEEILAGLRSGESLEYALADLVKQATKKSVRTQDNTTCVAIQYT